MSDEDFPVEDIDACLTDKRLQRKHRRQDLGEAERGALEVRRREAIAAGAGESSRWIYFVSPAWTWEALCGREGWLLYDPETKEQHAFFLTVMN